MRFLTAVALALVMLWVPVDGVAQARRNSIELVNLLYEERTCRRGTVAIDEWVASGDTLNEVFDYMKERRGWLYCSYVLAPHLEFVIEDVGPNASLQIHKVGPLNPYEVRVSV